MEQQVKQYERMSAVLFIDLINFIFLNIMHTFLSLGVDLLSNAPHSSLKQVAAPASELEVN